MTNPLPSSLYDVSPNIEGYPPAPGNTTCVDLYLVIVPRIEICKNQIKILSIDK